MAKFVLVNPKISITYPVTGAALYTDLDVSSAFMSLGIDAAADAQESTSFGDEWRDYEGGLKNWSGSLDFRQDFDDDQIDETMETLLGKKFTIKIWPDANPSNLATPPVDPTSVANPRREGAAILTSYPVFASSVGDVAGGSISLQGSGELARATT